MKTGLYVITHKPVKNCYPDDRKIMMVGEALGKEVPEGYYSDYGENEDNISAKNKNYCELTGLYYFIKNDDSEILSLEHYRRMFIKTKFYLFRYPFYKKHDIEKLMEKYDVILPRKTHRKISIFDYYGKNHIADDMVKVGEIIKDKYPDYVDSFESVMNGRVTYNFNMFIAKRKVIEDYSNWLFDILFELEKQIDLTDRDDYQKRVYGFLSERLVTVYFNKHKELKICEKRVQMFYGKSPFMEQVDRLIRRVGRIFGHKYN